MDDLIPGLPDDLARECLVRVGFDQLPVARRVSRQWKAEVESPFHHRLRRTRPLLVLAQAAPPLAASGPAHKYAASATPASYRLVLHDPAAGTWATLPPPVPGSGLPLFCQLAAVGEGPKRKLVVLGGWDPETWAPTASLHVYDFLLGTWRRGADMPAPRRSLFACAAADGSKWVFVAGGHDMEKNALRSAAAYDAEADAWVALPDMTRERDEARGVYVGGGRFTVIGGYPTEAQGRFTGSAEAFDPVAWNWESVEEGVVEEGECPRTCCAAPGTKKGGKMYMVRDGNVVARDDGSWWQVARVPEDVRAVTGVAAIGDGRVVVIGSAGYGAEQAVHVLSKDAPTPSWARKPVVPEFAGSVQAACFVQV